MILNRGESIDLIKDRKSGYIVVHLLVTLFGVSAWIGVNGIFMQLPILVNSSPEGWALPTYIVLAVQAANLGPIAYTIFHQTRCKLNDAHCILAVLILETASMLVLSFFYNEQIIINGSEYSLLLFILTFYVALVGCFSSILFMPYLRNFDEEYMVSYFIGEGLSGVLPSVGAVIQGIGENYEFTLRNDTLNQLTFEPKFSPRYYFLFVSVILLLSLMSFILLEYCPFFEKKRKSDEQHNDPQNEIYGLSYTSRIEHVDIANHFNGKNKQPAECVLSSKTKHKRQSFTEQSAHMNLLSSTKYYLFTLMCLFCFFGNGVLPSIQSYSCLPYGNTAYQLAITLAQFANPVACFMAIWIVPLSLKFINCLLTVSCILCTYVISVALLSPYVPLKTSNSGVILIVASWTILIGSISYVKLIIISKLRHLPIADILLYIGLTMQIGSACGAIVSFMCINFTTLLQMY